MRQVRFYQNASETKKLLISLMAVCALPTWIWFSKDRALRASTPVELAIQVSERQKSKDDFWRRLPPRHGDLSQVDADVAWQNPQTFPMQTAIAPNGADADETVAVLELARRHFKGTLFPVFAERGWVENQPTWIVGAAQPVLGGGGPFCGFSSGDSEAKAAALSSSRISVVAIDFPTQRVVLAPDDAAGDDGVQSTLSVQKSDVAPVTWSGPEAAESFVN